MITGSIGMLPSASLGSGSARPVRARARIRAGHRGQGLGEPHGHRPERGHDAAPQLGAEEAAAKLEHAVGDGPRGGRPGPRPGRPDGHRGDQRPPAGPALSPLRAVEIAAPDGTRLVVRDHGGPGPPLLLLHGLAGHAREWDQAAALLGDAFRVMAVDARGHGGSTRCPQDVSPAAHAADAAAVLSAMRCGPAIVAGHSLGGITAMHLAVARPGAVRLLVIADAGLTPSRRRPSPRLSNGCDHGPCRSPTGRRPGMFFGGPPSRAGAWADGLEQSGDGLRPGVRQRCARTHCSNASLATIGRPGEGAPARRRGCARAHGAARGGDSQEWMLAVQPPTRQATLETGSRSHSGGPGGLGRARASGGFGRPVQVGRLAGRKEPGRGRARRRVPEKH